MNQQVLKIIQKPFSFERTDNLIHQMLRYLISGIIVQGMATAVLYLLTEKVDLYYLYSESIGFMLGVFFNYFICVKWVFSKRIIQNKVLEFFLFGLIGFGGLILDSFFILILTEEFGIYYINSKLISLIIIYFYSFFVRKVLLFS